MCSILKINADEWFIKNPVCDEEVKVLHILIPSCTMTTITMTTITTEPTHMASKSVQVLSW